MSSRQFRENQAYFDQLRANQEYTGFKQARTGRFASDGTVAPDPSDGLTAGFIWIRILPGRQGTRAVIGSGMYGWERIPDLLVMTAINQSGERVCLRPSDTQEAVIAQQDKLANAPKPYVDSVQMTPGLVTANVVAGYGLSVYVQPFTYRTRVITGSLAITPPAVAGTRRMSVVYYDYSADALGVVYGTASALPASAWSLTDAITVALGDTDRIRLGAVLVANGDTVIAPTDKYRFFDCRDWLVLGGVQPGDTLSGITLVNTRELVESDNSGSTYTIDLTLGNVVALTLTADCTLTFPSSLDSGYAYSFTLKTIQDGTGGRDLTFPGSVSWIPDGTPAPDTGIATIAYYTFVTEDGGTSWYGFFNGDSVNGISGVRLSDFGDQEIVTISGGVLDITGATGRNIVAAAESGTSDTIDSIVGLDDGNQMVLQADAGDTIIVAHDGTNIILYNNANISLAGAALLPLIGRGSGVVVQPVDEKGSTGGAADFPQGYLLGLEVNCSSTTQVTINPGQCRDDSDNNNMTRTTASGAITVDITASGANGLDTGSEASNTWYYVWFIEKSSDGTQGGLLSTSATAPTMPSGYDIKRLVGAVRNNASSNFLKFKGLGGSPDRRVVQWQEDTTAAPFVVASNVNLTTTTWTDVDCSAVVPPNARYARLYILLAGASGAAALAWREKGVTTQVWEIIESGTAAAGNTNDSYPLDSTQIGQVYSYTAVTEHFYAEVQGYTMNLLPSFV